MDVSVHMPVRASGLANAAMTFALRAGLRVFERIDGAPARLGRPGRAPADAVPIVLVGGFANDAGFMEVWRRSLAADGYQVHVFDDAQLGLGSVREAARRLGGYVDAIRGAAHVARVHLVTFSAGGTVARAYASLDGGAPKVDRLITVDGSWRGDDDSAFLHRLRSVPLIGQRLHDALPPAFFDLQHDSALFEQLARQPALPPGVRVASIYPASAAASDAIAGATNIQLASEPGHLRIMRRSDEAYEAARGLLEQA